MLLYLMFIVLSKVVSEINAGTNLIYGKDLKRDCWTEEDLAKFRARKIFERLIPPVVTPELITNDYIRDLHTYFKSALKKTIENRDQHSRRILKEALLDTIGSHLRSEILPTTRFAYYLGYVSYNDVKSLHNFYDNIKSNLNTLGLGWTKPKRYVKWSNLTVFKIPIGTKTFFDPCDQLVMKRDANSCIHLPTPKLDDDVQPSAIALPFKNGGLKNMFAADSVNALIRYYTTASRCILQSATNSCRHSDFVNFNNEMWHWLCKNVATHLADEKLYSAYGGVLRVAATVQGYGKGLARRNLFDKNNPIGKWHPWNSLMATFNNDYPDMNAHFYISIVLLVAVLILILQSCYNLILGNHRGCSFLKHPIKEDSPRVMYTKVDSNLPNILPFPHDDYIIDMQVAKQESVKSTKNTSSSLRMQKVYDLNENKEKTMSIIMSDIETSDDSDSTKPEIIEVPVAPVKKKVTHIERGVSPPRIVPNMTQMTISRAPQTNNKVEIPSYSSTTLTRSEAVIAQEMSGSSWSATASSSSRESSSYSSRTRVRSSKSCRNLALARRIKSSSSVASRTRSMSGTELEHTLSRTQSRY